MSDMKSRACLLEQKAGNLGYLLMYHDGLPLLDSPREAPDTEAELRRLLGRISGAFLKCPSRDLVPEILAFLLLHGSPPICADHSDLFDRWIDKLSSGREDGSPCNRGSPLCPELRARTKKLMVKLLNERIAGNEGGYRGVVRSCNDSLPDMLVALRSAAADPCDQRVSGAVQAWKEEILRARKALFLRTADVPDIDGFPYPRKKQRTNQSLRGTSISTGYLCREKPHTELSTSVGSQEILQPTRRSKRTFSLLKLGKNSVHRKRIPLGEFFQADVPEWTGPPTKREVMDDGKDLDDSRWLGTQIWPVEGDNREISEKIIGKGRPGVCTCSSSGSVDCFRFHISTSRMNLKSELGLAFFSLGFDGMGEEVSKLWTKEEEMMFDNLIKLNPPSQYKSFWKPALNYFTSKSSRDIASYYFNVFILRRMSKHTRSAFRTADSDDDESHVAAYDDENNNKGFKASYTRYSQSFYYLPASVSYTLPALCQTVTGNMLGPS